MLPARGRTGVEDVLFGREQRQAVGIKVDRSLVHCGKSFQTTPAASLFTGPDGFRGFEYVPENSQSGILRLGRENRRKMYPGSFNAALLVPNGAICAAHSQRGGQWDCTLVFVQLVTTRFYGDCPTSR